MEVGAVIAAPIDSALRRRIIQAGDARFAQTARTVARLNHPHIVNIYDVGNQAGIFYLVMAFMEGESLQGMIAREGRLARPALEH